VPQIPVTANAGKNAEAAIARVSAASASPWQTRRAGGGGSASRRARAATTPPVAGSQAAAAGADLLDGDPAPLEQAFVVLTAIIGAC
jgi:hypothetical protein